MKNILVALDLKPTDTQLLAQASMLAEKFGSKIWLVHVATPSPEFVGFEMGPKYIRDYVADELRIEHLQLKGYTDELAKRSIEAEGLLIQGPTVDMIEEEVTKLNINLLVMGSHKHSFLYATFIGDTAVRIIKELPIPVMIVPLTE